MSLRWLTVVFLIAFALATALTGYAMLSASRAAVIELVDRRIDSIADAMLSGVQPGDAATILARIDAFSRRRDTGDIGFELEDAAGRRLGGNVVMARPIPPGFTTVRTGDRIVGLSAGRAELRETRSGLRLITIAETEPIDGYAAVRLHNYLIGFGAITAVVLLGTAAFGLLVRRRIGELRTTAEAIIDGDMRRRVPVDRHGGSFAEQALTFNRMLDRVATLMENLRNVSSDVAHDLRTPLARLRSRLAHMAAAGEDENAELDAALAQCDELMAMFSAVLRISEVEGGDRRAAFQPVDLAEMVRETGETMAGAASESGHALHVGPLAEATIEGDRQLLIQALINLIENALHHTPKQTAIIVSITRTEAAVRLGVTDRGPGIAPGDRARAVRRFGRLDASRNRRGHGLGLPLVDAIARLHRGALSLEDAAPGLAATIEIPLRRA